MKVNIELKDKDSKTISGSFGVTDMMLVDFLMKIAMNPSDSVSESIMAQSKNKHFGQIMATFASMYINKELHDIEEKLEAIVNSGGMNPDGTIQ